MFTQNIEARKMTKITEEEIMTNVYDLILNLNIHQDERVILTNFKNKMDSRADFSNELMNLSVELRQLAIKNVSKHNKMSSEVSEFYKKISSYGQLELNWARGLANIGMLFR